VPNTRCPVGFGWKDALGKPLNPVKPNTQEADPAQTPCPSGEVAQDDHVPATGAQPAKRPLDATCWFSEPLATDRFAVPPDVRGYAYEAGGWGLRMVD
jgi:hypothetical protein